MISKELLSEVLNYDVDKYTIVSSIEIAQIRIFKKDAEMWDYRSYDIHYLAHKCKKWALSNEFKIYSCVVKDGGKCNIHKVFKGLDTPPIDITLRGKSEVEAIIKACQWILDNKGNK